ncbi:MAG: hypothetical protein COB58_08835 [Thalassobium sp.]|nr:MAG: hypothetical protein COB58_08835 [Thalassobium sp.]
MQPGILHAQFIQTGYQLIGHSLAGTEKIVGVLAAKLPAISSARACSREMVPSGQLTVIPTKN